MTEVKILLKMFCQGGSKKKNGLRKAKRAWAPTRVNLNWEGGYNDKRMNHRSICICFIPRSLWPPPSTAGLPCSCGRILLTSIVWPIESNYWKYEAWQHSLPQSMVGIVLYPTTRNSRAENTARLIIF